MMSSALVNPTVLKSTASSSSLLGTPKPLVRADVLRVALCARRERPCLGGHRSLSWSGVRCKGAGGGAGGSPPYGTPEEELARRALEASFLQPTNEGPGELTIIEEKIEAAKKGISKACDEGTQADCAVAWEEVEELRSAADRKTSTPAEAREDNVVQPRSREEMLEIREPAKRVIEQSKNPCDIYECTEPTGSLEMVAAFERAAQAGSAASLEQILNRKEPVMDSATLAQKKAMLQERIKDAIQVASEICSEGNTGDCAVAWETVEELSDASRRVDNTS